MTNHTSILDVGGTSRIWKQFGFTNNVTLLNLTPPRKQDLELGFRVVQGDALNMEMFRDRQFDVVFSNSVIEHVGTYRNQQVFASEVQRVGKSWWVQTPNRYFPIEPHFRFPLFQFLPLPVQRWIALRWNYSHPKSWGKENEYILNEVASIRLMSVDELTGLFSGSELYRERVFGLTKSLVVFSGR
ncbi:MAG: class I SAM-dependent methyltransferase [Balneolaceae bacterium]